MLTRVREMAVKLGGRMESVERPTPKHRAYRVTAPYGYVWRVTGTPFIYTQYVNRDFRERFDALVAVFDIITKGVRPE